MTSLVQSRLLRPFFNTCAVLPLVRLYAKPSGQRWRFTSRDPAQPALAVWTWDQSEKNGCSASAARQAVGTPPGSCGRLSHRCAAPAVHRLALWSGQSSMAGAITYAASTSIDEITAGSIPVSRGGSIPVSAKGWQINGRFSSPKASASPFGSPWHWCRRRRSLARHGTRLAQRRVWPCGSTGTLLSCPPWPE